MSRKVIISVLLGVFLFRPSVGAVSTNAGSAFLIEANSNRVLYEQNADQRRLIASTTKIMTGLLVAETAKMDDVVTITDQMTGIEGSSLYLKTGEQRTVSQLLYGLMLQSGNDAAVALAYHCGGSLEGFVGMMNAKAKELGLTGTQFANPHGLNAEGHYSTARDLGVLSAYAMRDPRFVEVVSSKTANVGNMSVRNHNKMLWIYPDANGIKTGYTIDAGRCLVSSAERDGRLFIAVTLDDPNDWQDHAQMLDFAFEQYPGFYSWCKGELISNVPVFSGRDSAVDVIAANDINLLFTDEERQRLQIQIECPHYIWAPVKAGSVVGSIRVTLDGKQMGSVDLVASKEVPEAGTEKSKGFWGKLFSWGK